MDLQAHYVRLLVNDEPGVLSRITLLFSRRGYNIDSVIVSAVGNSKSAVDVTATGDPLILDHIIKQLEKLVDVDAAFKFDLNEVLESELALVKVRCSPIEQSELMLEMAHFGAKGLHVTKDYILFQVVGAVEEMKQILSVLSLYEVAEIVRSGRLIIPKKL